MGTLNFLSIEQMQTLRDLGLEMKITPYAYYKTRKEGEWEIKADNDNTFSAYEYYEKLPIYGLENLIDTLPNNVWIDGKHLYFNINKRAYDWCVGYHSNVMNERNVIEKNDKEMLNALYKMVVFLIKEGMLETSKIQKFDIEKAKSGKAVRTRNGMKVRIICYNRENRDKKCIVALIKNKNGNEQVQNYYADGTSSSVEKNYDLIITDENG